MALLTLIRMHQYIGHQVVNLLGSLNKLTFDSSLYSHQDINSARHLSEGTQEPPPRKVTF